MTEFIGVIPKDLATGAFWPQIRDQVARALKHGRGEYSIQDILDAIDCGELFAVGAVRDGVVEFVAIAGVARFPRKSILSVMYGAGRGGARLKDTLMVAMRTLRCDWIEFRCRPSVARLWRPLGVEQAYQLCILEQQ